MKCKPCVNVVLMLLSCCVVFERRTAACHEITLQWMITSQLFCVSVEVSLKYKGLKTHHLVHITSLLSCVVTHYYPQCIWPQTLSRWEVLCFKRTALMGNDTTLQFKSAITNFWVFLLLFEIDNKTNPLLRKGNMPLSALRGSQPQRRRNMLIPCQLNPGSLARIWFFLAF